MRLSSDSDSTRCGQEALLRVRQWLQTLPQSSPVTPVLENLSRITELTVNHAQTPNVQSSTQLGKLHFGLLGVRLAAERELNVVESSVSSSPQNRNDDNTSGDRPPPGSNTEGDATQTAAQMMPPPSTSVTMRTPKKANQTTTSGNGRRGRRIQQSNKLTSPASRRASKIQILPKAALSPIPLRPRQEVKPQLCQQMRIIKASGNTVTTLVPSTLTPQVADVINIDTDSSIIRHKCSKVKFAGEVVGITEFPLSPPAHSICVRTPPTVANISMNEHTDDTIEII